jgi:SP family xylose:H+ symportor-like MFS transporter
MVASFNQLAGINAVIYYTADIFAMAGAERASALLQSVIIGFTNLVFTMIGMTVIDRFGRRRLLLIGAVGLAGCLTLTAWAFHRGIGGRLVLASLLGYIAFFAFSQGAVIWVYISEIFPNRVRARGQALGSFTHWFWAAVVSWSFPVIADASGASAFAFFAVMMVLQFVLVWRFLPETKGVSLEQIQRRLGIE